MNKNIRGGYRISIVYTFSGMPWGRKGDERRGWLRAATPASSQDGLAAGRKKQTSKQVVAMSSDVLSSMCGCESIQLQHNYYSQY